MVINLLHQQQSNDHGLQMQQHWQYMLMQQWQAMQMQQQQLLQQQQQEQPPVAPWRMEVPVPPPPAKSAPAALDSKPSADGSAPTGPAAAPPAAAPPAAPTAPDGADGTAPTGPAAAPPAAPTAAPTAPHAATSAAPTGPAGQSDSWLRQCRLCGEDSYWREDACLNPHCKVARYVYFSNV